MSLNPDPLAALSAPQLAALLGCARSTVYARWADGSLPYLDGPSGRRTPRWLLEAWQRDEVERTKREPDVLAEWKAGLLARRETGAKDRRESATRSTKKTRRAG